MPVQAHGDAKYQTGHRLKDAAEWSAMRVELWRHEPGVLPEVTPQCTELAVLLSGQATVKRAGDGQRQQTLARPGTAWLCPAGIRETNIEISADIPECIHIFLPPTLIDQTALQDYDIDPARVNLAYAGGFTDQTIHQIASSFRMLLEQGPQPLDRLFVDGMRTALAGHLLGKYTADRWQPAARVPSLDHKRLQRVLDFIEARLSSEISLDDLAAEACLSPFHFARLFRISTGLTPHRYVTDRRIEVAKQKLAFGQSSLVEISLDAGFGSQANFSRVFRKATGMTPGQFRAIGGR